MRHAIQPDGVPVPTPPYSPVVVERRSGLHRRPGGDGPDGRDRARRDRGADASRSCATWRPVWPPTGCGMDDVVKITVFLTDLGDFAVFNEVYAPALRAAVPGTVDGAGRTRRRPARRDRGDRAPPRAERQNTVAIAPTTRSSSSSSNRTRRRSKAAQGCEIPKRDHVAGAERELGGHPADRVLVHQSLDAHPGERTGRRRASAAGSAARCPTARRASRARRPPPRARVATARSPTPRSPAGSGPGPSANGDPRSYTPWSWVIVQPARSTTRPRSSGHPREARDDPVEEHAAAGADQDRRAVDEPPRARVRDRARARRGTRRPSASTPGVRSSPIVPSYPATPASAAPARRATAAATAIAVLERSAAGASASWPTSTSTRSGAGSPLRPHRRAAPRRRRSPPSSADDASTSSVPRASRSRRRRRPRSQAARCGPRPSASRAAAPRGGRDPAGAGRRAAAPTAAAPSSSSRAGTARRRARRSTAHQRQVVRDRGARSGDAPVATGLAATSPGRRRPPTVVAAVAGNPTVSP